MSPAVADTKQQLELRLLLAAAARAGIAPTVAASGSGVVEMIRDASVRGARLIEDRRSEALGCKACGSVWREVLVPEGALDVGCPSCEGELALVDIGRIESAHTVATPSPGAATVAAPIGSAPASVPPPVPTALGPYRVVRTLGRGGMGAVLEAVDTRSGASVALKLISGWGATDEDARTRFLREGKVLTLLAHPHVVRFVEQGELEGQLFIAMELVRGGSLADELGAGKLPVLEAVRRARAIAEGLAYAHALGLVHRDVKPANVLLGEDGSIKLADFGLARRSQESLALTAPGTIVGTPVYMAPEQLEGKPAGPPSDVYALGVLLYHMLAGAPPFEGSFAQIALQRSRRPIEPLGKKCPEVPGVLANLVDRMLAADPAARPTATDAARALGTLEPPSTVVRPAVRVERDPRALEAGSKLGAFTIEGKLGAGGMGSVYRARGAQGESVALKVLAKPLDPAASQRFAREARALSEVQHPNVVKFLDAGEADGLAWIATELVPGRSLDAIVSDEGPLPEARLLDVAEAVGKGLAALHAKKIVHRDVKPQNVVIGDGRIVLVDLGLAKFLATQTAVTEAGALLGTPHYMAPEQLLGKSVDARTDLYSLGALLHHAATAKRPFDGESNTAVAFQQVNVTPPSLRKVRPGISGPFAELVAELLEKARDRRPASSDELLALLARVRRGQPLDEARARIVRWAYAALVAIVVACGFAAWWSTRPADPLDPARSHNTLAKAEAEAERAASTPSRRAPAPAPVPAEEPRPRKDEEALNNAPAAAPAPAMKPVFGGAASDEKKAFVAADKELGALNKGALADDATQSRLVEDLTILIPAGTYEVGPPDKRRKVELAAFSIDRAPVCRRVFDAYRSGAKDGHLDCDKREPAGYRHHGGTGDCAEGPVCGLDVWDAAAYANWTGARLPTSEEWEVAFTKHPELAGTTYEWTLDFAGDSARGRLHAGSWKKKDLWAELESKDAGLDQCGFRCARSQR